MSDMFDATRYLSKLRGKDYLEVKWRALWFRTEHPEGSIETELVSHDPGKSAVFRATVRTGSGGIATGYAEQGPEDFKGNDGWFEKCETKAIGRALGWLGYGTQFTEDEGGQLADSPVERPAPRPAVASVPQAVSNGNRAGSVATGTPQPITSEQVAEIQQYEKALGQHPGVLNAWSIEHYGRPVEELYASEARALIAGLKLKAQRLVESGTEPAPA